MIIPMLVFFQILDNISNNNKQKMEPTYDISN